MIVDAEKYGPWAVIAGGSEGVGRSLARELADAGINLVLIARKPGPLAEVAHELAAYDVEVEVVEQDLLDPHALDRVRAVTDGRDVGLFIYNAGANTYRGEFVESDPAGVQGVIDLNVTAPLAFLRHYGRRLKERRRGGIMVVGSMSGFTGYSGIGVYAAAKAFLRIFVEGLWLELRPHGVDVVELCLGLTRTPAMERLGMRFDAPGVKASDPDVVAREGLAHLPDGPSWIADGNLEAAAALVRFPRAPVVTAVSEQFHSRGRRGTSGGSEVAPR